MTDNTKDIKINANLDGLDKLLKSLKSDYCVRVGIIGAKAGQQHKDTNMTNAELGAVHEFGSEKRNIPKRSFLELPLKLKLNFNDSEMKEIKKFAWKSFFVKMDAKPFFAVLGAKAIDIINGAFETNGYGEWQSWSKAYEKRRRAGIKRMPREFKELNEKYKEYGLKWTLKQARELWTPTILTLSSQLRKSISFKVIKNK